MPGSERRRGGVRAGRGGSDSSIFGGVTTRRFVRKYTESHWECTQMGVRHYWVEVLPENEYCQEHGGYRPAPWTLVYLHASTKEMEKRNER